MSSTPSEVQLQSKLDQVLSQLDDIRNSNKTDRLFDVMEIVRDQVGSLSREHESIRTEIREIVNLLIQQQTVGAD